MAFFHPDVQNATLSDIMSTILTNLPVHALTEQVSQQETSYSSLPIGPQLS